VKMKFIFDQVETLVPEAISQFHWVNWGLIFK
jgi:hypothetical protein